jgi:hypothetical protein
MTGGGGGGHGAPNGGTGKTKRPECKPTCCVGEPCCRGNAYCIVYNTADRHASSENAATTSVGFCCSRTRLHGTMPFTKSSAVLSLGCRPTLEAEHSTLLAAVGLYKVVSLQVCVPYAAHHLRQFILQKLRFKVRSKNVQCECTTVDKIYQNCIGSTNREEDQSAKCEPRAL